MVVSGWVVEFLLRQPDIPDPILNRILTNILIILHPPTFSLYNSLLLRRLQSETTVSQNILDLLELIEELRHVAGVPVTESMRTAYRLVAEDCGVWSDRVRGMMAGGGGDPCGLVTEEERERWIREKDANGEEKDAMGAVRAYMAEAWEELGPPFLEVVAGVFGVVKVETNPPPNSGIIKEVVRSENNQVLHQHSMNNDGNNGLSMTPRTEIRPVLCFCKNLQTVTYEVVRGSYVPSLETKDNTSKDKSLTTQEVVGAFQKLPMVQPSIDILYSALRKAKRIAPSKGIANVAKRVRNKGAKQLDALMKELAVPLRMYKENFPNKKLLHPYERSLVELTLGDGNYEEVLGRVDALRKKVTFVGKENAALCAKSTTKKEAEERLSEGMEKLEEIFKQDGKAVDDLITVAKSLRAMPVVDLEIPTLCLVGAPNVGKSSLVRILSTGKPEICNYPFTTRGILMGHISFGYQNFQVTDTPGLLKRLDDDRNNLEKLTLAVLSHLPTAVLYVHDLTGECGMSASDQFLIYKEIRDRFSGHLWLDVVSKCDLLKESPDIFITEDRDADNDELARYRKVGPEGAIHVSVMSKAGLDELKTGVHDMLVSQSSRIGSQYSNEKNQESVG